MHAAARVEVGSALEGKGALAGAGLNELAGLDELEGLPETASGFASSFFHIGHLDSGNRIFEAVDRRVGLEPRL